MYYHELDIIPEKNFPNLHHYKNGQNLSMNYRSQFFINVKIPDFDSYTVVM